MGQELRYAPVLYDDGGERSENVSGVWLDSGVVPKSSRFVRPNPDDVQTTPAGCYESAQMLGEPPRGGGVAIRKP